MWEQSENPACRASVGRGKFEFTFTVISLGSPVREGQLHAACTLYPVTADSSAFATTGSHLMLTVDPEKVQEMLPGGLFGAKRYKTRQRFSKSWTDEKVVLVTTVS